MGFGEAIRTCFSKFVTFQGRARRSEFWYFGLFIFLASIPAAILDQILAPGSRSGPVSSLLSLIIFLPSLSVNVRRMHDVNRSGWILGGFYIYIVAALAIVVALAQRGGRTMSNLSTPDIALVTTLLLGVAVYGTWIFVLTVLKGTSGPNRFGPDPIQ